MTSRTMRTMALAGALMLAATGAMAGDATPSPAEVWAGRTWDYRVAHRDQQARWLGLEALREGRDAEARIQFERAARYADKPAQALLADLWWDGRGGPRDRAVAYAWMDLAAERGDPRLAARREHFWSALDEADRARARVEGRAIYAGFADDVAQPRLERERRRWMRQAVGSRLGSAGASRVCDQLTPGTGRAGAARTALDLCATGLDSSLHYADARLDPADYWRARDAELVQLFGGARPPER